VTAGNTCFEAPVHIPNGASVLGIDLEACDNVVNNLTSTLYVCTNGSCTAPFMLNTFGLSGCGHVSQTSGGPVTVDNNLRSYFLQICTGDTTGVNKFRAGRILYALQVSPAPATATFTDVPTTQPFFRFIEAFARAGITGGCGPGLFCPGANVTRQEMATFMAVALGLHFPN
jgi:hypothetical protein